MNKTIWSFVIVILLLTSGAEADTGSSLKVFSMNLHCFKDGWQQRFDTVLTTLAPQEISVYAFQEVCISNAQDQVAYLIDRLQDLHPGKWTSQSLFTHRAWDKYGEYLLIIARGGDLSVHSEMLPASPLQRGFVSVQLGGVWFVNTHLEYHEDNSAFRLEQLEFLVDQFSGQPRVLMGDFNSSPDMKEQLPLLNGQFEPHFPGPTFPASRPEVTIDGFWLSPRLKEQVMAVKVSRWFGPDTPGGIQSDHLGVLLEMGLRPEPE